MSRCCWWRWRGEQMPIVVSRILEYAGLATIGSLIAGAVFRVMGSASTTASMHDVAIKVIALTIAFVLYLKVRRSILALALGYTSYVLLALAFAP